MLVNVRGDGNDCVIVLDIAGMLHDGIRMTLSDNGTTIFTEDTIPVRHIKRVSRLNEPKHTLYFRQTCERLRLATNDRLDCIECHASHPLGTQWCPTRCGVPLTPWGVGDRIAFYACKAHRRGELLRYGWTPTQFEEVRRKENGPSVNALTVKRHADGVLPDMRHGKLRKTNITAPMASSVESERVNVPAAAAHCTVPVAHLVPAADVEATIGGRSRAELQALCEQSGISNAFIVKREAGARRNEEYKSHTDRYRRDDDYRAQCEKDGVPEWLVNSKCEIVRFDGRRGDELRGPCAR